MPSPISHQRNHPFKILGPGAMGICLNGLLIRQGFAPAPLYGRGGALQNAPFRLIYPEPTPALSFNSSEAAEWGGLALWLVTVKSFQIQAALAESRRHFLAGDSLLILANGSFETELSTLSKLYPQQRLRRGVLRFAAKHISSHTIQVSSDFGDLYCGALSFGPNEPTPLEEHWFRKLEHFYWARDIERRVRIKWLYNATLNTLCAQRGLPTNGHALAHKVLLKGLFAEAYAIGRQLWGDWEASDLTLWEEFMKLLDLVKDNENSMACDRRLGRKTEFSVLGGLYRNLPQGDYPLFKAAEEALGPEH